MARFMAELWLVVLPMFIVVGIIFTSTPHRIGLLGAILLLVGLSAGVLLVSQPIRVGFSRDAVVLTWVPRTERMRWDTIEHLSLSLQANELKKPQDERLFAASARLASGRQRPLGNLIGSIANPMMFIVSPEKTELWVIYRWGRAVKYLPKTKEAEVGPGPESSEAPK